MPCGQDLFQKKKIERSDNYEQDFTINFGLYLCDMLIFSRRPERIAESIDSIYDF